MMLFKFIFIIFIIFLISPLGSTCRKKEKKKCPNGQAPLAGVFCGRGPTRQDCPSTHECIIAPNDAYAVCCPRTDQTAIKVLKSLK